MKAVLKVFVFLLPVFVFVGLARKIMDIEADFLPTYEALVEMFGSCPDFNVYVNEAIKTFNEAQGAVDMAWASIDSAVAFFSAVGSWFYMVGQMFVVFFQAVSIPFRFIGWFVPAFFTV